MKRFKTVDEFIAKEELWQNEMKTLRKIVRKTELVETVKWGCAGLYD